MDYYAVNLDSGCTARTDLRAIVFGRDKTPRQASPTSDSDCNVESDSAAPSVLGAVNTSQPKLMPKDGGNLEEANAKLNAALQASLGVRTFTDKMMSDIVD